MKAMKKVIRCATVAALALALTITAVTGNTTGVATEARPDTELEKNANDIYSQFNNCVVNNARQMSKMFGKSLDRVPTIILNADIETKKLFISNINENINMSKTAMAGIRYLKECIQMAK